MGPPGRGARWRRAPLLAVWPAALCGQTTEVQAEGTGEAGPSIEAWEPTDAEYWCGGAASTCKPPFEVPRLLASTLTRDAFDKLVREGRAFVVRSVGATHPMRGWNCTFFQTDPVFREVQVKREYGRIGPSWLTLAELGLASREGGACSGAGSGEPLSPYYLGIKEAIQSTPRQLAEDPQASATWSVEVLRKVHEHTVVPPFMDPSNKEYLQQTPELWFSCGTSGGGAKAHVDQHTESTMSLQLSGRKRWRVAPVARRAAPHVAKLYQDGQIYSRGEQHTWNILQDVYLDTGDAIFFGPGFIHETEAEPGDCAASVTWQFSAPYPTKFWRSFLPRLRWTPDLVHTWSLLRLLLSPGKSGKDRASLSELLDSDGDGTVSDAERAEVLGLWKALEDRIKQELPDKLRQGHFGIRRVVEDDEDLAQLPTKVRRAIRKYEQEALAKDEALASKTARTEL